MDLCRQYSVLCSYERLALSCNIIVVIWLIFCLSVLCICVGWFFAGLWKIGFSDKLGLLIIGLLDNDNGYGQVYILQHCTTSLSFGISDISVIRLCYWTSRGLKDFLVADSLLWTLYFDMDLLCWLFDFDIWGYNLMFPCEYEGSLVDLALSQIFVCRFFCCYVLFVYILKFFGISFCIF